MMKMRVLLPILMVSGIGLVGCIPPPPPPPAPLPPLGVDLVTTDIAWPVPLVAGQRVPFSITVQNIGDTATPANTILDVLITVDGVDIGWSDNITVPLAPSASRVQIVNGGPNHSDGLWTVTAGDHNVQAYVNSGSLPVRPPIPESNRDNNKLIKPFLVRDTIVLRRISTRYQISSAQSDGSNQTQLTFGPDPVGPPVISGDETKIAYTRETAPGRVRLWVMNVDGTDQREVVAPGLPDTSPGDRNPSWSPDGTQIAFIRDQVGLLTMSADGSDPHIIVPFSDTIRFSNTSWSPDGTQIAFDYKAVCCNTHIYITKADGSGAVRALTGPRTRRTLRPRTASRAGQPMAPKSRTRAVPWRGDPQESGSSTPTAPTQSSSTKAADRCSPGCRTRTESRSPASATSGP